MNTLVNLISCLILDIWFVWGFFLLQNDFKTDLNNSLHNIVSLNQIYLSNEVCFIRTFITLFEHSGVKDQKAIFLLSCSQNHDYFSEVKQCFFKFPVLDVSSIDESSPLCWNSEYKNCPSLWKLLKGVLYFFYR